ncbi:peroxisome biogenesis factor 10-like [Clavelina lepadiformis]|uniref:peroxisome biogenesis factor 10-like n=1 Tax=Clavelina lepadiformis TaxID=159417 RepID=UPI0040429960
MPLVPPDAVTQICSHQKDQYYINSLKGMLNDSAQQLLGSSTTLKWSKEINVFADVAYYALTTAGSLQTLGEEYTGIIQVDGSLSHTPSWPRRIALIFFHSVLPFAIDKLLNSLEKKLQMERMTIVSEQNQTHLLEMLPKFKSVLVTLHRFHLSLFYMKALYYTVAKRVSGVQYLKYFSNQPPNSNEFGVLGKFALAQACLMLGVQLYSLCKEIDFIRNEPSQTVDRTISSESNESHLPEEQQKCSLCLEKRKSTTTTSCGHLFCWFCIHEWVNTKPECPLCREKLQPNKLVCLKNF